MKIHQPKQAKARLRSVMPPRAGKATSTKFYCKSRKSKANSWKIYKSSNGSHKAIYKSRKENYKASGLADQVKNPPQAESKALE